MAGRFLAINLFILVSLFANTAFATMFFPLSFEKQVEEATSAAEVKLAASKVYKNSAGGIMTEYRFEVLESYNLSEEELDQNQLKISMPGGTLDGITSMIDGAPEFKEGEKTFLLLKKIESKIYLSNFTLGKYKIQTHEGKDYYVSEVFPMDQNIGRISKEKMIELIKEKWKLSSVPAIDKGKPYFVKVPPAPERKLVFEKRAPAQASVASEEIPVFFWGALILIVFFFVLIFIKLGQSGQLNKRE